MLWGNMPPPPAPFCYCSSPPSPSHCLSAAPCSPRSLWTNFVNFSSCSHSMHNAFFFVLVFSTGFWAVDSLTQTHTYTHSRTHTHTHTVAHTAEFLMNSNERLLRLLGQTRCAVAVSAPKRAGEHFTCALQVAASLPRCKLRVASCKLWLRFG